MNRLRDADTARYMARKLADELRRKGGSKPYPGVSFVRDVIRLCGGCSVQSGKRENLRIVIRDPSQELSVDNAALLTSKESYVLTQKRRLQKQKGRPLSVIE